MDLEFKKNLRHKLVRVPETPQGVKLNVTVEIVGKHEERYLNEPLCIEFAFPDPIDVEDHNINEYTTLIFTFRDHPYTIGDMETAEVILSLDGELSPEAEITVTAKPQKSKSPITTRTIPLKSDD